MEFERARSSFVCELEGLAQGGVFCRYFLNSRMNYVLKSCLGDCSSKFVVVVWYCCHNHICMVPKGVQICAMDWERWGSPWWGEI